jgi:hypothetical protein
MCIDLFARDSPVRGLVRVWQTRMEDADEGGTAAEQEPHLPRVDGKKHNNYQEVIEHTP